MKLLRIGLLQVGTTQLIVAVDISGAKSIFVLLDYSTVTYVNSSNGWKPGTERVRG